jgi:hypothetical protein
VTDVTNEDQKSLAVLCPNGERALSGGARVTPTSGRVIIGASVPFVSSPNTGWAAAASEVVAQADMKPDTAPVGEPDDFEWALSVYAVCAKIG